MSPGDRQDTGIGITEELAGFAVNFESQAIPSQVRHQAARCLVNWAGCALGGARHPALSRALTALQPFAGAPKATLIGRSERVDALHAALLNGISSHVLDFDDTHLATLIHPSGPVLPALLALTQHHRIDGRTFVDSIACGIEVECRIGLGIYPAHYDIGWHITGTVGGFGAAAAAGRALRLDAQQMAWALGIAATQAGGLREMFGTMCKSLHPGRAAQSGLSAALMAAAGFTSSTRAIEAPRGFAHVLSTGQDFDAMRDGLGETWETLSNSFKPYACGLVIHPVIDGCISLRKHYGFDPQSIEGIVLHVNPLVLELTGKAAPQTGLEGKFSVYHSAAAVLIDGFASSRQYSDAAVRDPVATALRQRVVAEVDPSIRKDEARIEIRLRDGRVLTHHVVHALGSKERPMSDEDLSAKFRDLAEGVLPAAQVEEALALCWNADSLPDAAVIAERLGLRPD